MLEPGPIRHDVFGVPEPIETMPDRPTHAANVAAMLAHEVNNLMAPVLGRAQLALRDLSDAVAVEKALFAAVASAQQASEIASAMLETYASPQAYAGELLQVAVERAVLLSPMRRGIAIELDLGGASEAVVPGSIVSQVVLNLVRNAAAAIERVGGVGEIRLVASMLPPSARSTWNTPMALIRVIDTGPGLDGGACLQLNGEEGPLSIEGGDAPRDDRDSSIGHAGGYGLGLAVCRRLSAQVGGTVELINRLDGPGAEATLMLPCGMSASQAA